MSNRCRIDRNGVKFFLYSKCRVGFETKWGKEEEGEARERERKRGRCIFTWPFPKEKEGWIGRSVCVYGKWKEGKRKRERKLEAASNATRKRERERERERERSGDRPAPEEYKFMSMQHKVASTTSQPIHTHLYPQLSAATLCARFPDRPLRHSSTRSYRSR